MKTALLFAGQATQYVGMGRLLYGRFPEARALFQAADEALAEPLSKLCFKGPEAQLLFTENTQPAVLTVACAAFEVLKMRGFQPTVVAGHSLGEISALVAAGSLKFEDAVRLARRRGAYMRAAVPPGVGAMSAIQRLDDESIQAACEAVEGICVPAAFNAPEVVIISGEVEAVAEASWRLAEQGAMITPLQVSAPFHTPLLQPAAERLVQDLAQIEFAPLSCPYIPNVEARWVENSSPQEIRQRLRLQVISPVLWRESIALMLERGIERFWHLGPGRSNLTHVKRQARRVSTGAMDRARDLEALLSELDS